MLDPLLFGCYSEHPEPPNHPMGPLFFKPPTDVDAGIEAALKLFDLPWSADKRSSGLSWWFTDELAGVKMEVEVELHAFALANLFRSVEMKEEDRAVEYVEIIGKLDENAEVMHVFHDADPPMPRSDEIFVSALRERDGSLCVCEWAVPYSKPPADRTIRNYPFFAARFHPTGAHRTQVSIIAITAVAAWMPRILVCEEMEKRAEELQVLKNLPNTPDGTKLIDSVLKEVWNEVATNVGPCAWNYILHSLPDLEPLGVTCPCAPALPPPPKFRFGSAETPRKPTTEPLFIIRSALAVASSNEWTVKKKGGCHKNEKKGTALLRRSTALLRRSSQKAIRGPLCCDAPRKKGTADAIEICKGPWPHSLRVRLLVHGIHPMALALALTSEEGKRFSDEQIVQLEKLSDLGNFSTVWYQRSRYPGPMSDRDMVYQSVVQDISHNRCVVCEWPVESDVHPEAGSNLVRARQYMLWDLVQAGPNTAVTLTCMADVGGPTSRWLKPFVDHEVRSTVNKGMQELMDAFTDDDGVARLLDIETQFVEQFCDAVRKELTPMQLGFMEAYSPGF